MKKTTKIKDAPPALTVKLLDIENGFQTFENVRLVRIKSRYYTLLIMRDHMPALGEMEGTLAILTQDREVLLDDVRGFYHLQHNQFTFIRSAKGAANDG